MTVKRVVAGIWPDSIGENIDTDWPRKVFITINHFFHVIRIIMTMQY